MKGFAECFVTDGQEFELNKPAILIVDMLNDFCKEGGLMVLPTGAEIYDTIYKLTDTFRKNGYPVIYINDWHRADTYDKEFEKRAPHCIDGTWGAEVIDELKPQKGDYSIQKRRFSGFYETDLNLLLSDLKVDTVVVTGVVTNICVASTCSDAFFRGYNVIVPEDCVRATAQREQDSTLWDIATHFGTVTNSETIQSKIK